MTFVRGIHRWPVNSPHKGIGKGIRKSLFSTQQKHLDKLTVLVYKKSILHIQGIKAIYHDNQVEEKQNKTKYT